MVFIYDAPEKLNKKRIDREKQACNKLENIYNYLDSYRKRSERLGEIEMEKTKKNLTKMKSNLQIKRSE